MKKNILLFVLLFFCSFFIYAGSLKIDYYIDRFGDDTSEGYITQKEKGLGFFTIDNSINNSIVWNLIISKDEVSFVIYEGGTARLTGNELLPKKYTVFVKDNMGETYQFKGANYSDRISLIGPIEQERFKDIISNSASLQIVIESDSIFSRTSYNLGLLYCNNYKELWDKLYGINYSVCISISEIQNTILEKFPILNKFKGAFNLSFDIFVIGENGKILQSFNSIIGLNNKDDEINFNFLYSSQEKFTLFDKIKLKCVCSMNGIEIAMEEKDITLSKRNENNISLVMEKSSFIKNWEDKIKDLSENIEDFSDVVISFRKDYGYENVSNDVKIMICGESENGTIGDKQSVSAYSLNSSNHIVSRKIRTEKGKIINERQLFIDIKLFYKDEVYDDIRIPVTLSPYETSKEIEIAIKKESQSKETLTEEIFLMVPDVSIEEYKPSLLNNSNYYPIKYGGAFGVSFSYVFGIFDHFRIGAYIKYQLYQKEYISLDARIDTALFTSGDNVIYPAYDLSLSLISNFRIINNLKMYFGVGMGYQYAVKDLENYTVNAFILRFPLGIEIGINDDFSFGMESLIDLYMYNRRMTYINDYYVSPVSVSGMQTSLGVFFLYRF